MTTLVNKSLYIRRAISSDKERLIELINAAYRVEDFFKYDDRVNEGEVEGYLNQGLFFVGEDDAAVKACIHLEINANRAYFGLLSVDPSSQGKGWGKRMMEYVETEALKHGCAYMDIQIVNVRPELPVYYGKYGYVAGAISAFPKRSKIPCHFVQMSKKLSV
jgi:GNAT superfamily N-acetyltransferase